MYNINKYNIRTVTHFSKLNNNELLNITKSNYIAKFIEEFMLLENYSKSISKISILKTSFLSIDKYSKNRYLLLAHFLMGIIKINDFLYYIEKIFNLKEKDITFFNTHAELILNEISKNVSKTFYKVISSSKYWFSCTEKKEITREKLIFIYSYLSNNSNTKYTIDNFNNFLNKFNQLPLKKIKCGKEDGDIDISKKDEYINKKDFDVYFDENLIKQKIYEDLNVKEKTNNFAHIIDEEEVYSNKIKYEKNDYNVCAYYYYNKTTNNIDITSVKVINKINEKYFFRKDSLIEIGKGATSKIFTQKNEYKQQTIKKKYLDINFQKEFKNKKFEICYKIIKDDLLKEFFLAYHVDLNGKISAKALTKSDHYQNAQNILKITHNPYSTSEKNEDDLQFGKYLIKKDLLNRFILAFEKFQEKIGPLIDIKPENIFVKTKGAYIIEIKVIDYYDFLVQSKSGVISTITDNDYSFSPLSAGTLLYLPISQKTATSSESKQLKLINNELNYIYPNIIFPNETTVNIAFDTALQIQKNVCRYSLLVTILELLGLDIDFSNKNYSNERFNNKKIKKVLMKFINYKENIDKIIKFMNILHTPEENSFIRNYFESTKKYKLTNFLKNFNLNQLIN